jgi:hypothetical protein
VEQVAAESEAKALARASRESAATLKAQLAQQRTRFQAQQVRQQQQHAALQCQSICVISQIRCLLCCFWVVQVYAQPCDTSPCQAS